jgi:hypothetical protein
MLSRGSFKRLVIEIESRWGERKEIDGFDEKQNKGIHAKKHFLFLRVKEIFCSKTISILHSENSFGTPARSKTGIRQLADAANPNKRSERLKWALSPCRVRDEFQTPS